MRKILFIVTVLVLGPVSPVFAQELDLDLDLETCNINGFFAKMLEKWDPLEFWTDQVAELNVALKYKQNLDFVRKCRSDFSADKPKMVACLSALEKEKKAIKECIWHAKRKCLESDASC